jgi:hypothetical protein
MMNPDGTTEAEVLVLLAWSQACSSKQILLEGDAPEKTIELACNAMEFASGMIDNFLKMGPRQPACRKGCSYCCHLPVEVSAPEILAIGQYVREKFSEEERQQLARAIDAHIATTEGMDDRQRSVCRTPCPLLRDGACSVYEVRPLTCRGYHSFDAEPCRRDCEHPTRNHTVPCNGLAYLAASQVGGGLSVALRSQRLDYRMLDLARALKIALENPELLRTWRDQPRVFDPAVRENVHPPTQEQKAFKAKLNDAGYRHLTNRPAWSEITAEPP